MREYGFGVDIGGTACKIGLFRMTGELLEKWEIPTDRREGGKHILADVAAFLEGKLEEKGIQKEDVEGIGVGIPGPVRPDGSVPLCVNLGWENVNVREQLGRLTGGMRVEAVNDANAAALGEMWQGGGKGSGSIVMVTLGTGVGGGVVLDGKVVAGSHGAGGEIGHLTVRPDENVPCNCGRKGCLEQYASATGIARMARERLAQGRQPSVLRHTREVTAKDVFDAYKAGDALAADTVGEFARVLGNALSNIACVADPEAFVIGGGVSKAGKPLLDAVEEQFRKSAFPSCAGTKFALASLGNDAGIYGGVRLLMG